MDLTSYTQSKKYTDKRVTELTGLNYSDLNSKMDQYNTQLTNTARIPVGEVFTATANQTIFNLSNSYVVGQKVVAVEIDGVPQKLGEGFTESSTTSITLAEGVPAGAIVKVTTYQTPVGLDTKIADVSNKTGILNNLQTTNKNSLVDAVNETVSSLADKATKSDIGISITNYPRLTGETDDILRFQRAIDYLASIGGGKLVIPKVATDYIFTASNPTINSPRRVLITTNNINIEGVGLPTIQMKGITKAYIDSINDKNSSGRDVFTAFSFLGVDNCSIKGIKFVGEWDGTGTFRYQSPRAKAVGFTGCLNSRAENLFGFNLLGNLVNDTPADFTNDGLYRIAKGTKVINCYAEYCLENGFNFMGNTFDGSILGSTAKYCGSAGFEGASNNLTISNNLFTNNKIAGVSISGKNVTASSNVITGNGSGDGSTLGNGVSISYTGTLPTSNINLANNYIGDNDGFGIQVYSGVNKLTIDGNTFVNNSKANINKQGISLIGTSSSLISNVEITNNQMTDELGSTQYYVNMSYADHVRVENNKCSMVSGNIAYAQGTATNCMIRNNKTNVPVLISGSAVDCYQYNNNGATTIKIVELSAIPTTGTWKQGDMIINPVTSASGSVSGWRCITSGTFNASTAWTASTDYTVGAYINANSKVYRCTVAGTSGTTAPSHTSGFAADGTVTWSYVGQFATPVFKPLGYLRESNSGALNYNGDGAMTKTIAHGLSATPTYYQVTPATSDAGTAGVKFVIADATNLTVYFNSAPPTGTNNITLRWKAEV
ncbi:hypothetical protein [Bacillus xiapuensis]|uniref:Right handed beta helix domain-containing protein n=1 Tax=Bacillus xiapuensis TaxID=2014075 RepID=A0ABU6N7R1_9BACI|nr:hypothetical protein [Bacillus xiapuensis]